MLSLRDKGLQEQESSESMILNAIKKTQLNIITWTVPLNIAKMPPEATLQHY